MLHHEESPEKPQYNMATPPFLDNPSPPPFSSKNFQTPPPTSINFDGGGGIRTMLDYGDIVYENPNNEAFINKIEKAQYDATGAIRGTSQKQFYPEVGLEFLKFRQ